MKKIVGIIFSCFIFATACYGAGICSNLPGNWGVAEAVLTLEDENSCIYGGTVKFTASDPSSTHFNANFSLQLVNGQCNVPSLEVTLSGTCNNLHGHMTMDSADTHLIGGIRGPTIVSAAGTSVFEINGVSRKTAIRVFLEKQPH